MKSEDTLKELKNEVDISSLIPSVYVEDILDLIEDSDIIEYISDSRWSLSFIDDLIDTLTEEQLILLINSILTTKIRKL